MTVYIEYVLIDNLVIDYLILKITHNILKKTYSKPRLLLSGFLGAVFALLHPLYAFGGILELAVKLLVGVIVLLTSRKYKSVKDGFSSLLTFMIVTFIFGGCIYAVFGFLGVKLGTEVCIVLIILPILALYKMLVSVINFWQKNKEITNFTYDITLTHGEISITGKGFLDTGNLTYVEGAPAVIISSRLAHKLLSVKDYVGLKKIKINTASGQSEHCAVKIKEFSVLVKGKWNIYTNVWCVIVPKETLGDIETLFGSAFWEGENVKITA